MRVGCNRWRTRDHDAGRYTQSPVAAAHRADSVAEELAVHRHQAMTILPSLIPCQVNTKPCPCLTDGLHLVVVSSSPAQSPVSIASKLDSLMMPDGSL